MRLKIAGVLVATMMVALVASGIASGAQTKEISCTGAAALQIKPSGSGATYTIDHGSGWCVQGVPFKGDWSVSFSGSGTAQSFNCTAGLSGTVSGLVLNVTMNYHNNRTGVDTVVNEVWSSTLPTSPYNMTALTVTPGGTPGLIETHIFNACPPGGSPSTYLEWQDKNPN